MENLLAWVIEHALTIVLSLFLYVVVAYILASMDICFTFSKEGAAKAVVKGDDQFDHMLVWWRGHRSNDPRKISFDTANRPWEIVPINNANAQPSLYAWWKWHWRLLELFGICWYGLYPLKKIYVYEFTWTEESTNADGKAVPWRRQEYTDFIFIKNFSYWIKLEGAEDKDNQPLDLDYLLTIHVNNPYWALFRIEDWLSRVIADANNKGKVYVGSRTFDEIRQEDAKPDTTTSVFSKELLELNTNLVTEPGMHGTRLSYGVTITAASLVNVAPSGLTADEVTRALTARRVAELNAQAAVATAKGQADATREKAKGDADAIETVYSKVDGFGDKGVVLQGLDAIRQASASPGSTVIWANNPLGGLMDNLRGLSGKSNPPTTPATTDS